ncbi:hypothetical protein [Amycolatopsis sp. H20-H5]|uniref:hypothetical protein n=1 Tax=Amycolatopsis sp. H20-H5 TaxID=3046309 RepID=UPI002DBBDFB4|nr:hypothetical protein [Amycolatopsis sp. H20-H5]MEC3975331.1 hypothetical protein [Amycolatopsis sp. H20-H5]
MTDNTADRTDDERRSLGQAPDPVLPGQTAPVYDVPRLVAVSFWFWIASGVVLIAGQVYSLIIKQQLIDALVKQTNDPNLSPAKIASGTTTLLWTLFGGAVVFAVLLALFAYKAREGTRSARSVLTVLAILAVLFQAVVFRSPITVLSALLLVIALLLLYLPASTDYFPKVGRKLS